MYAIYNYLWDKSIFMVNDLKIVIDRYINQIDQLELLHKELYFALRENHMIVTDSEMEMANAIKMISAKLSSDSTLQVTINPTMDCNLRCWYCYETHGRGTSMSKEVVDSIYKFFYHKIKQNVKDVRLSFFGGEPFIHATQMTLPMAKEIVCICKEFRKNVSLHFTTNGTLLTSDIIEKIAALEVSTIFQIAFDGGKEFHNKTKSWSKIDTYERTLNNINCLINNHMQVVVRCNYTSENIKSFMNLIEDIDKLECNDKRLIRITFQRIWQEKDSENLFEQVNAVHEYAKSFGYNSDIAVNACINTYCYADYDNSFVFNYNGDVFKCTARDFDQKHKIGAIMKDGSIQYIRDNYTENIRFKVACKSCSILPICTICSQAHIENKSELCSSKISEEDKEKQIKDRFQILFKNYA